MRRVYLVAYDISDAKRLRLVHRAMCGFGDRVQYSVFRCELNAAERMLLEATIVPLINAREDQVLVVPLGPVSGRNARRIVAFGRAYEDPERRIVVV